MLGDIDELVTFASKIEDLRNVHVSQLLCGGYLFSKLLPRRRIDAVCRDQLQCNWLASSIVYRVVARRTVAIDLVRSAIGPHTDAVVLKKSCTLHDRDLVGHSKQTIRPAAALIQP